MAIHGGAGMLLEKTMASERAAAMTAALHQALDAGIAIVGVGGPALDAVEAAVQVLEDAEVFNAGRGAVLRSDGTIRLDASIMCGASRRVGAVAGVKAARNPIALARRVLERGGQVMLIGEWADRVARAEDLVLVPPEYFVTAYRQQQLLRTQAAGGGAGRDHDDGTPVAMHEGQTVGAVASDTQGHLAAATSTGGTVNASPGRVGDSPIIGAGTWADNRSCAVSGTGDGEYFIRAAFAHAVHARCLYAQHDVASAASAALQDVRELGGAGGCVAIDCDGHVAMPFTTTGMARACETATGERYVCLFASGE